jgi:hypothetical protein
MREFDPSVAGRASRSSNGLGLGLLQKALLSSGVALMNILANPAEMILTNTGRRT